MKGILMSQELKVCITCLAIMFFVLMNCGTESSSVELRKGLLANSPSSLEIATYDGSGHITHPDVIAFERPWNGFLFWMAATPYPNRDSSFENPSVFASNDGVKWTIPEGASNPIALPPANAHLSDPDIIYDDSCGLRVYYRLVDEIRNRILFVQSKDGRKWTPPVETISVPNHQIVSPAVVVLASRYVMYSVRLSDDRGGTSVELRESRDGIRWSSPKTVSVNGVKDKLIWHLDASYVPARKEFWLLYYSYPSAALYLAVSKDGLRFNTLSLPILTGRKEPTSWESGVYWDSGLYRSTFQVRKGDFLLWYTGTKAKTSSHIGFTKADVEKILSYFP